jgi:hypothetical protein
VFTCSWANGPPRCIQEHGAEQRDAVDDVDEIDVDEEADEGGQHEESYLGEGFSKLPSGLSAEWTRILKRAPNEYGAVLSDFSRWPSDVIVPRDHLVEAIQSAMTGKATSFAPAVQSMNLRPIHVCDPPLRYGFECPCAFHGFGCETKRRRWNQKLRRVGGLEADSASASGVYNCSDLRRQKTTALKALKELSLNDKKPLEGPRDEETRGQWEQARGTYKALRCQFLSTDPRLFQLYSKHSSYVWVELLSPVVYFQKVAMSKHLLEEAKELSMFMSPNAIAGTLKRCKAKYFEKRVAAFYSAQLLARRLQLRSIHQAPVEEVQHISLSCKETGIWFPSDNFIRDFLLVDIEGQYDFMDRWTASHVLIGETLAMDDSMKVGKGSEVCKKTVMNEFSLIEMSLFDKSTSYETQRVQSMGTAWAKAREASNAPPIR